MSIGPRGKNRPMRDDVQNAHRMFQIAIGEAEEEKEEYPSMERAMVNEGPMIPDLPEDWGKRNRKRRSR